MKLQQRSETSFLRQVMIFILKKLPFAVLVLIIAVVLSSMMHKISLHKAELKKNQAGQIKTHAALANVITMEITPGKVVEKISLPGVAKPWISLTVPAEVKGKVIKKLIHQGDSVNKGDVLALIDTRDYAYNYASALASYETAKTDAGRFRALSKKQFITQAQLDNAKTRVKTTSAAMEQAKLNLGRCTIRSPMKGIADKVHIEVGSFLSTGDPVADILKLDRLKIEVGIPESDVSDVRRLKNFNMIFDALNERAVTGTYHYLFKTTASMARLYNLEIEVENPGLEILPDMFARVSIIKNQRDRGLTVPIYSLVTKNKKTGVFVENDSKVSFRHVSTGFQDGWRILVTRGLEPGEKVIVVGHHLVEDGDEINVIKTVKSLEELSG